MAVAASHNPQHDAKMKSETFHIIGGGIAGLASALAVTNSGHQAIVIEKATSFEAVGAGLQLGPNAVRALQKLGAWDAVSPITTSPLEIQIRNGVNGKTLKSIPLGKSFEQRHGMPYRVAQRADLIQALLGVAKTKSNFSVQLDTEVIETPNFKNVIAADGVWSKIRQNLFPGSAAIVTKEVFYRANISNTSSDNVTLWLYPGGHVVHYPIGSPAKLNLVAITQGQTPFVHFANACAELKEILTLPEQWTTWPAAYVPPLQQWHQNNVTLIGDAAHGTLPYLAQGAAMALEDAAALQNILMLDLNLDASQRFKKLGSIRIARTNRLHRATMAAGKIYHMSGIAMTARNTALEAMPTALFSRQQNWIYGQQ